MDFSHFDEKGKALMVDVTEKKETERCAVAAGKITVSRAVYEAIENGTAAKGDVLAVATTDAVTLVVLFLTFTNGNLQLDITTMRQHFSRHDSHTALSSLA